MVTVVKSNDFEVPRLYPSSRSNKNHKLKGFPTFYSENNEYILPVNLWLNYLINVRNAGDVSASVRAIKKYWDFLEASGCAWNAFPSVNYLKPTYRFRNDILLKAAKEGSMAYSTASLYIQQVIHFYEWAAHERFISFSEENKPFDYQLVNIANTGMMNHNNPRFVVRSTDLRIRKPARNDQQKLNPLMRQELERYADCLTRYSDEFIIHQLLQLQSGLRVNEACTFPLSAVFKPDPNNTRYEVDIGPFNGVLTKFSKTRKVEVPYSLMRRMYVYAVSERRFERAKKFKGKESALLLSNRGKALCSNNIQQYFRRIKRDIEKKYHTTFLHRTHDLRASYGTYRLDALLEHIPIGDAMALVMSWMGHKDDKTTWKYLRYLRKEEANHNAVVMLDQILEEALL